VHPLPAEELEMPKLVIQCAPSVEEDVVRFDVAVDDHLLWMYVLDPPSDVECSLGCNAQ
jgi:hypothetical protein